MKIYAVLAAAAIASVSADTCSPDELGAIGVALIEPAGACEAASGYTIIPPSAYPTADQVKKICASCTDLITAASKVTIPSCTLNDIQIDKLFNDISGQCKATTSPTPGTTKPTTTSPSSTAPGTTEPGTTAAPGDSLPSSQPGSGSTTDEPSTDAPSGSASSAGSDVVESPSANTTAPTVPGAASSVTLGAAIAVACSIAAFVL